ALETFNLFDTKGDSKIEARHIGELVRALGLNPSEADIRKCGFQNARISFETFMPIYQTLFREDKKPNADEFIDAFCVFDKDANGLISAAELRHLLTALGERLREDEVDQLLAGMENAQGLVPYEGSNFQRV
ncbi:unnamed protein product, partial [Protopolystoma xenopodis]